MLELKLYMDRKQYEIREALNHIEYRNTGWGRIHKIKKTKVGLILKSIHVTVVTVLSLVEK